LNRLHSELNTFFLRNIRQGIVIRIVSKGSVAVGHEDEVEEKEMPLNGDWMNRRDREKLVSSDPVETCFLQAQFG
jgi:hypothetical protein